MTGSEQIAIVGIGNLLLKDEGIGIHIAHALQKMTLPSGVEAIDGGTSPELMPYITGAARLVVIDAMETGDEPGSVYRLRLDELNIEAARIASTHEINLIAELKLMRLMGKAMPETTIIGIQPAEISWGTELSPQLEVKIPEIVRLVLREIGADRPENGLAATASLEQAS
jgi:hydrogenase maturation protease